MFQGSEHVAKGEHFAQVQAGGRDAERLAPGSDRTNYFETAAQPRAGAGLWLEADGMASLLPAMTQEKLDNQREVVKNERRWSVDNQPYGNWDEQIQALRLSRVGIRTTTRPSAPWRTWTPRRWTTCASSSRPTTPEQRGADRSPATSSRTRRWP